MPMTNADTRRRELAAIHVAKKQLGLDDDTYRAMLWTLGRVESAADLDHAGRQAVIEHLRRRGFVRAQPATTQMSVPSDYGKKPAVSPDKQPLVDKIEALLADAARPWNYARSMAKRMFKFDALEFATAAQLRSLVAALEYDRRRRERRKTR